MKMKFILPLFLLSLPLWKPLEAFHHPEQGIMGFYEPQFEAVEPFEKIYVKKSSLVYMPQGIYLKHLCGVLEKIQYLAEDYKGSYILRIHTLCPECGRIYTGKTSPEGWSCLKG